MALVNIEEKFFAEVIKAIKEPNANLLDIIIEWAEDNDVEVEYVASLVQKNLVLKSRLQIEAENLHFLKKTVRLPI